MKIHCNSKRYYIETGYFNVLFKFTEKYLIKVRIFLCPYKLRSSEKSRNKKVTCRRSFSRRRRRANCAAVSIPGDAGTSSCRERSDRPPGDPEPICIYEKLILLFTFTLNKAPLNQFVYNALQLFLIDKLIHFFKLKYISTGL